MLATMCAQGLPLPPWRYSKALQARWQGQPLAHICAAALRKKPVSAPSVVGGGHVDMAAMPAATAPASPHRMSSCSSLQQAWTVVSGFETRVASGRSSAELKTSRGSSSGGGCGSRSSRSCSVAEVSSASGDTEGRMHGGCPVELRALPCGQHAQREGGLWQMLKACLAPPVPKDVMVQAGAVQASVAAGRAWGLAVHKVRQRAMLPCAADQKLL